jgi:serine/threonine protein kinase
MEITTAKSGRADILQQPEHIVSLPPQVLINVLYVTSRSIANCEKRTTSIQSSDLKITHTGMASLRDRLRGLRTKSTSGRYFIPDGEVENLMSEDVVRDAVSKLKIDRVNLPEVSTVVSRGGKKTFAILVMLREEATVWDLMKQDQFTGVTLDAKLPWSYDALRQIVGAQVEVAKEFVELQWEFIPPVFDKLKGHRLLHDDIVLPYISELRLSKTEGSFGAIFKTEVYARHLPQWSSSQPAVSQVSQVVDFVPLTFCVLIDLQTFTIIRKQLPREDVKFENEQRVLQYLNHVSHPYILQLFASYTLRDVHILLFPLADLDLDQFLKQSDIRSFSAGPQAYLYALAGLSSALEMLHTYSSNELQVDMIGCHHDLKPNNVFVTRGRFVLADFGLSTLKSSAERSSDEYKHGAYNYRAPECEDPEQGFKIGRVTRASDIWSFACILAEVETYIANGPSGVEEFFQARKLRIGDSFISRRFYASQKMDHPEVLKWLESLGAATVAGTKLNQLTDLIRHMLSINVADRPKAHEVTTRLREMALVAMSNSIEQAYTSLAVQRPDPRLAIEHQRILLWGWAMGFLKLTGSKNVFFEEYFSDLRLFENSLQTMSRLKDELTLSDGEQRVHAPYNALQIRRLTDELFENIPEKLRPSVQNLFELRILTTEGTDSFAQSNESLLEAPRYLNLDALAAIKRMSSSVVDASNEVETNLIINANELRRIRDIGIHEVAQYTRPGAHTALPVLVEYKRISSSWTEKRGSELVRRVQRLADMLNHGLVSHTLRVLRCVGYRCEVRRLAFSLAFEFPERERNRPDVSVPFSLQEYLADTRSQDKYLERPSLNDRFELAARLAETVLGIHKVGWLHKSIMSSNVLFFQSSTRPKAETMNDPYLIGFYHSRPDDPQEFTETPNEDFYEVIYRHPAYATGEKRFRLSYDDHSLGLILLEIGLWRPLKDIVRKVETRASEDMHKWILTEKVPQLSISMGAAYENVVTSCLDGIMDPMLTDENLSIYYASAFEDRILKPLGACALATRPCSSGLT